MFKKEPTTAAATYEVSDFAKNIIRQQALAEGKNESTIIDDALATAYLPAHTSVQSWCRNYLLTEPDGIQMTLAQAFDYVNTRVSTYEEYQNMRPLVVFAHRLEMAGYHPLKGNERNLDYLCKKLHSLHDKLVAVMNERGETDGSDMKSDIDYLDHMIMVFEKGPENGKLADVYNMILQYWDDLKDWDYTYRTLWCLADMAQWKNTADMRMLCLGLLHRITADWYDEGKRDPLEEYFTA